MHLLSTLRDGNRNTVRGWSEHLTDPLVQIGSMDQATISQTSLLSSTDRSTQPLESFWPASSSITILRFAAYSFRTRSSTCGSKVFTQYLWHCQRRCSLVVSNRCGFEICHSQSRQIRMRPVSISCSDALETCFILSVASCLTSCCSGFNMCFFSVLDYRKQVSFDAFWASNMGTSWIHNSSESNVTESSKIRNEIVHATC